VADHDESPLKWLHIVRVEHPRFNLDVGGSSFIIYIQGEKIIICFYDAVVFRWGAVPYEIGIPYLARYGINIMSDLDDFDAMQDELFGMLAINPFTILPQPICEAITEYFPGREFTSVAEAFANE
jgi:hypothetical protein